MSIVRAIPSGSGHIMNLCVCGKTDVERRKSERGGRREGGEEYSKGGRAREKAMEGREKRESS